MGQLCDWQRHQEHLKNLEAGSMENFFARDGKMAGEMMRVQKIEFSGCSGSVLIVGFVLPEDETQCKRILLNCDKRECFLI